MNSKPAWVALFLFLLVLGTRVPSLAQLLGQWHFDEGSGTVASDSLGLNDGNLSGDAAFVSGGIVGNAVSMTKAGNGFVEMGDIFPMTFGDFSVVVWVKTSLGDQQAELFPVSKHVSGAMSGYFLAVNTSGGAYGQTDKAFFYTGVHPGSEVISTSAVNDGAWHQVVGVYRDSGQAEIFVDGAIAEDSKSAPPIGANVASFMAGGIHVGTEPVGSFDGQVDELQVFGNALSSEEVQLLFEDPQITLLFASGFESGDTSTWSSTKP